MSLLAIAAQQSDAVDTVDRIVMPQIQWRALASFDVLVFGVLLFVLIAALGRHTRWIHRFYVWATCAIAAVAGGFGIAYWSRARDLTRPVSAVADALRIDGFSVFITVLTCAVVIVAALVAEPYLRREGLHGPEFFALMLLAASGGVVMASANDLVVLFLGLEILSLSLYVLAGSNLRRSGSQEAALKYFVLGGFSSAVFLYGIALTYGATGSTNMSEIADYLGGNVFFGNGLLVAGTMLMLVGLAFKVAAVPFHMWTPDVYQGAPSPATGFMAAAAKAAGFAGLLRVLFTALDSRRGDWRPVIWALAIVTMIVGAVLAAMQSDVKRIMAYSSITHAGFILVGLQAANEDGRSGALFYLAAYAFIVLGSFAVISVLGRGGSHDLSLYRGLGRRSPALAVLFTLFLLAQAGIPATSGFMAKFGVIRAAADAHSYAIAIVAMFASVIAAFAYLRIVVAMFMSDDDTDAVASTAAASSGGAVVVPMATRLAILIAAAVTLFCGIAPQLLVNLADKATLR